MKTIRAGVRRLVRILRRGAVVLVLVVAALCAGFAATLGTGVEPPLNV